MRSRPISFGNSCYVDDSLTNLRSIRASLQPLVGPAGEAASALARMNRVIESPSAKTLLEFVRFFESADPHRDYYHLEGKQLRPGKLRGRSYRHITVMLGPGIGLGDEIVYCDWIRGMQHRHPGAKVRLYSFFHTIWKNLLPDLPVADLSSDPMAAFRHVERSIAEATIERSAVVFCNFPGHKMLSPFARPRVPVDVMEIALGSGEFQLLPANDGPLEALTEMDPVSPNHERGLARIFRHLYGEEGAPTPNLIGPPLRPVARDPSFRLVINPLTSKRVILESHDWVDLVGSIRQVLPKKLALHCQIYPGLTEHCRTFAATIRDHCQDARWHGPGDTARLLTAPDGGVFEAQSGIAVTRQAIAASHLLVGIDTFSAHLAAHTETTSIALCLWRNPEFWQQRSNTLWLNTELGRRPVRRAVQWVVRLLAGQPLTADAREQEACQGVCLAPNPAIAFGAPRYRCQPALARWLEALDRLWRALPSAHRKLLRAIDADYAWPLLRGTSAGIWEDPQRARRLSDRLTESMFYRLVLLRARVLRADRCGGGP